MIAVKLRKPFQQDPLWVPDVSWLWVATLAYPEYTRPSFMDTLGFTDETYTVNETPIVIGQAYVDNVEYEQTASLESCVAIQKSFFFVYSTQKLYIHLDHTKRMDSSDFDTLEIRGYATSSPSLLMYYDDTNIPYRPYLKTNFVLSDEADRAVFSKMSFISNSLDLFVQRDKNGASEFDYIFTSEVPGADIDVLYAKEDNKRGTIGEITPQYKGYAQAISLTYDNFNITVGDKREQFSTKYPNTYFSVDDYPDMETDLDGEVIPVGYGNHTAPAFCINGTLESGVVTYKYATDGATLSTVYVLIDDVWTEVTPTSSDAEACEFTLSEADGRDDNGKYYEAKVECTLRTYQNPARIIQDLASILFQRPFNSDYYDFQLWSDESALLEDVNLYMGERKTFYEWVELLQNGSNYNFIFRINADGKFWIKVDDITREVSGEYCCQDIQGDERRFETDFTTYATDMIINYGYDATEEAYSSVTVDTYKDATLDEYRLEQELEYDSLLETLAQAQDKAEILLKDYKKARKLWTFPLKGILDIELLDVIEVDTQVVLNLDVFTEYAGIVKIKIASYEKDFANSITTVTGYDITDIVSKGTKIYTPGILTGHRLAGHKLAAITKTYQPEVG